MYEIEKEVAEKHLLCKVMTVSATTVPPRPAENALKCGHFFPASGQRAFVDILKTSRKIPSAASYR